MIHASENPSLEASDEPLVVLAHLVVGGASSTRLIRESTLATAMCLGADRCELLQQVAGREDFFRVVRSIDSGSDTDCNDGEFSSVASYALLCGAPILSGDLGSERRFDSSEGFGSAMAAPLPIGSMHPMALAVHSTHTDAFTSHHALMLLRTASLLGGALELLRRNENCNCRKKERRTDYPELTRRQIEVLRMIASGMSAKLIASRLGLKVDTVYAHSKSLYRTLGVASATGAIRRGREIGLL